MKKVLGVSVIVLLFVALIGYFTMQYFLGSIVKAGVNKFGPTMTQTKVELQGASLSPFSGQGTLTGLAVGNPQGWSNADAVRLGSVHIDLEPFSIFKDHIVINEIVIDSPEFLYETKLVASNIGDILKNVEAAMGGNKAAEPQKDGKPIKMVIKKFTLRNGKVTLGVGTTALPLPMPPVEIVDIGTKEGGITPAGVVFAVMRSVTSSVVAATTQALSKLGGTSGAAAGEGVRQVGEAIKGLFGGKKTEPAPAPAPEKK
jgi:hypothetical protein